MIHIFEISVPNLGRSKISPPPYFRSKRVQILVPKNWDQKLDTELTVLVPEKTKELASFLESIQKSDQNPTKFDRIQICIFFNSFYVFLPLTARLMHV